MSSDDFPSMEEMKKAFGKIDNDEVDEEWRNFESVLTQVSYNYDLLQRTMRSYCVNTIIYKFRQDKFEMML